MHHRVDFIWDLELSQRHILTRHRVSHKVLILVSMQLRMRRHFIILVIQDTPWHHMEAYKMVTAMAVVLSVVLVGHQLWP